MATKRERAFAFFAAILFLVSSVGFSLLVIWQIRQEDNQNQSTAQIEEALNNQTTEEGSESMLQGTQLSDFTPVEKVDSLQIIDLEVGTGEEVKAGDTITAHYTGALAVDGTIFQSSLDSGEPFTSALSGLIQGWQEGIPGMKAGGTRRLLIPAAQAYGDQEQEGIPANSDLVFDIQLESIGAAQ